MTRTMYLIDNNALVEIGRGRIETKFFTKFCRVTSDVLHEASERPEYPVLEASEYKITPKVLKYIGVVMKSVRVGDVDLVDLYHNKGTADPSLIATALDAKEDAEASLFPDCWVIVTNDQAVMQAALEFGIETISPQVLANRIDAAI